MENTNISQRSSTSSQETSEPKKCWICFGTSDDDYESNRDWVSPCKCRGSTRWVHQDCIQRWVDEKLKEDFNDDAPHCPQCHTYYVVVCDKDGYFIQLLNGLDRTSNHLSLFLAAGFVGSALYWSGVSYGAITIIQMFGEKEAIKMLENIDPFILLLVLPSIPFILIVAKTINWEKTSIVFMQRFILRLPLLRTIMPSYLFEPVSRSRSIVQFNAVFNPICTISTAILLPTTGSIIGNILFKNSSYSCLQKALLGGLVYITVKGIFRMYRRHCIDKNIETRKIINYPESDTEENY